ncbi:MAG TPA: ABC transporter ATP-binding protein [Clostridia bacterium]|nr:ABC transporter ATP-binding protein [Clostridia bacterium]
MAGPMGPQRKGKNHQKPKDVKKTFFRLLAYLFHGRKALMIFLGALVVITSFTQVAGTYFIKPLINNYIVPLIGKTPGEQQIKAFLMALGGVALVYLVGIISRLIFLRTLLNVSQSTLHTLRKDLFERMQDLPIKFFDTHTHGELMSRYTNDVDTIRQALSQGIPSVVISSLLVVSTFIMMIVLSWELTLLVIVMLAIMYFVIKVIGGKSAKYFREQQKYVGEVNGYIEELIEGQKVVKVFCHEGQTKSGFKALNAKLEHASTSAHTFASIIMPIMGNISYIHYAATATLGAFILISGIGTMTIGALAAFLQFTRQFAQPITQVSQQFNNFIAALAGAERIFEIIDTPPEQDDGYVTLVNAKEDEKGKLTQCDERTGLWAWKHPHNDGSLSYTKLCGDVRFENVTFGYDKKIDVLKDISLYAKPGQKIAFVGSTGAGKTTITNLINRFYDIQKGKITYDGININKIKKNDLRRSLAMVLQDTHLFNGTVRDNIAYGKLDATNEEIIAAAKLANADSFISRLPQGYDTELSGDGANLSQGQRQLLSIARAAVANPPVLILDEATSSIDTRTERLIEMGMDKLMEGKTVFVIAHRLSTVRNSDAIMVLEHGSIIERGNHDSLIEQRGKYYQLYTGQFELE